MTVAARVLGIRTGEGRLVGLLAALFAAVEAGRGLGEVGADTLFLSRFGADALPYLFILLGAVSLVVAQGYGAGIGRLGRRPFLVGLLGVLAALLLVERAAMLSGSDLALPVMWVSVYAVSALMLTVVWTVAGTTLDVRQAKRLFPVCTGAAILGGFGGTLSAGPLARVLGTENLIVLYAASLIGAAGLTWAALSSRAAPVVRRPGSRSLTAEIRAGFDYVRGSPLMRLVAVSYVLFAVLLFSVSFPFLRAMGDAFDSEADLATALGLISAAVTAASFLLSVGLANRLYARIGIVGAALLLPAVYLAGFGLWLVAFSLSTAIVVRFAQQATQRGISNAAWSALYTVVPAGQRPQVLAFVDGVPGQIGISLSGILLLVGGAFLAPAQVFVIGAVTAAICLWVVLRIRARYGEALLATLRAGLAEQVLEGGPGLDALGHEPHVIHGLRANLSATDAGSRRLAAGLLGRLRAQEIAPDLAALLDDPEPEVRVAALRSLAVVDAPRVLASADRLATDPSAAVRAELAVALAGAGDGRVGVLLRQLIDADPVGDRVAGLRAIGRVPNHELAALALTAIDDPDQNVRAGAITALSTVETPDAGEALVRALDDEAPMVRAAASVALASRRDLVEATVLALRTGSSRAQEAAVAALSPHDDNARSPLREWALAQLERAVFLSAHGVGASAAPGTTEELLGFVVTRRRQRAEDRLLTAIAAPDAREPIRRAMRAKDRERRAQAIEALDATGDRQLGGAMARLLDSEISDATRDIDRIGALLDDRDPWIRTLAQRVLREHEPDESAIIEPMPHTEPTLGEIDRMLLLRRVPLFAKLDPEDLQRIAALSIESLYAPHEPLVHEGDFGDELIVILEGTVLVVQGTGAEARLIRTYGSGDHIGELAVLRNQPRAATVVAGDNAVRGLLFGGEALRSILQERPDAAMAMLATLADRISAQ